tara:strand:+ start:3222 stop:3929 length:708 start_codon:yes stop_codon:yes gene_type:complete
MPFNSKTKWKRIINELGFLYDELSLIEDLTKNAGLEFEAYYRAFCAKKQIDRNKLNQDNKERIKDLYGKDPEILPQELPVLEHSGSMDLALSNHETSDEEQEAFEQREMFKELHAEFHKLFKKLALKLHPDRIENYISDDDYKQKLSWDFSKAKSSFEKKDYFKLIQLAKKYDILVPENYDEQCEWFKKERDKLSSELRQAKSTYNYKFAECENDEQRDKLVRSFIRQVFKINIK